MFLFIPLCISKYRLVFHTIITLNPDLTHKNNPTKNILSYTEVLYYKTSSCTTCVDSDHILNPTFQYANILKALNIMFLPDFMVTYIFELPSILLHMLPTSRWQFMHYHIRNCSHSIPKTIHKCQDYIC